MHWRSIGVVFVMTVVLVSAMAAAQTSRGTLQGVVRSAGGEALAAVRVTVSSPALQGTRTVVTDDKGFFRVSLLPPGTYRAAFNLPGFQPAARDEIVIGLEMTITLETILQPVFAEEVLVTSEAPVLDVTSTTVGANLGRQLLVDLPTGRSFQSLAFLAPGAVDGGLANNPSIMGSSSAENRYVVDELDITDPLYGTVGRSVSFNFLQEVQVKTGGYEAEYGGALGGVVNMITKSGSNELHGEVFAYYTDDSFAAEAKIPTDVGQVETGYTEYDLGFDLGGKIVTDKLWYFIAYNPYVHDSTRVAEFSNLAGDTTHQNVLHPEATTDYYAGKLTWQVNESNSVTSTVLGDPTMIDNDYLEPWFVQTPYLPTNVLATSDRTGGPDWAFNYNGILSKDLLLEIKYGMSKVPERWIPQAPELPSYFDLTSDGRWTEGISYVFFGGTGLYTNDDSRERRQLRAALTWFLGDAHELKAGVQQSWLEAHRDEHRTGATEALCVPIVDDFFSNVPERWEYCDADGDGIVGDGVITGPSLGAAYYLKDSRYRASVYRNDTLARTDELSLFVQDALRATDYLTVQLGVRADAAEVRGSGEKLAAGAGLGHQISLSLGEQLQPRVGVIWDFAENGRSKLYGHYGRFYESIPLDINVRAFGDEHYDYYCYYYPESGLPSRGEAGLGANPGALYYHVEAGTSTGADAGLGGQYLEEIVFGAEYEVMSNLAVGLKGIYRSIGEVIEDISVDNGWTLFITNPGGCYETNPVTGEALPEPVCFPRPSRIFRGIELSANKRFSDSWQLYASLLWSSNKGNYGGLFRQDNGKLDPNITTAWDLPRLLKYSYGPLPNDRQWQLKAYGSYRFDFGLVTGGNLSWMSGTPVSKLGCDPQYSGSERFVEPRGSAGRTPDVWQLDLHLAYPFRFGNYQLEVILDVFNVFNRQEAVEVLQFYTWSEDPATDDDPELLVPWYGLPTRFQPPRNYRVGLKLSW